MIDSGRGSLENLGFRHKRHCFRHRDGRDATNPLSARFNRALKKAIVQIEVGVANSRIGDVVEAIFRRQSRLNGFNLRRGDGFALRPHWLAVLKSENVKLQHLFMH